MHEIKIYRTSGQQSCRLISGLHVLPMSTTTSWLHGLGQTVRFNLNARCCARIGLRKRSERRRNARDQCMLYKLAKLTRKALYQSLLHPNSCNENLINQSKFTDKIVKNTFEDWKVYPKLFWAKQWSLKMANFEIHSNFPQMCSTAMP